MIERTISLINVRKKEKKWITENFYSWILKLIHDESLWTHEEGGRCPEAISRKFTLS